ncbi:MarR family winged helix-turn-helix transcriptional regulator [Arthrobacter sp. NIO-1057]|uniref:MarR family winged helix-turn-helix transcriptional regulator n=1 Tax=Arthrobacter sp. NIO-1057 TaxID=993071 RepID=UPI000817791C|nr:MarR family winged helix-turn-helix transcriptional regulator [Arthrobacter sp. NIO-1057]SCC13847.1 DNA-binding transcriptional regulator, MarR family [Arthrobacter sp. NIO-1057]
MSIDQSDEMSIGTLLFIAQRAFEEDIVAALHASGFEFTLAQGRLAARIAENGSRLTDLASAAGITKQSAAYLVNQLETAGLVSRHDDPHDARAQLVVLTAYGKQAQKEARKIEAGIEARWQKFLGEPEFLALKKQLLTLREQVDRHDPTH